MRLPEWVFVEVGSSSSTLRESAGPVVTAARRRRRWSMTLLAFGGVAVFVGFVLLAYAGSEVTWTSSGFYAVDAGFPALLECGALLVGIGGLLGSFGAVVAVSAAKLN